MHVTLKRTNEKEKNPFTKMPKFILPAKEIFSCVEYVCDVCVSVCMSYDTENSVCQTLHHRNQLQTNVCYAAPYAIERNFLFISVDRTLLSKRNCCVCSMYRHLQYLLDDFGDQASGAGNILNCKHDRMLVNLTADEKEYIAKTCINWEWNVGSIRLLRSLQTAHILTMSEYIVRAHNKNSEEAQLILNDLFEMEFILLADLVQHMNSTNPISIQISDILQEGVKHLCIDLCGNSTVLSQNYLLALVPLVLDESMESLKSIHLKQFLTESSRNTVAEAVCQQKRWNDEFEASQNSVFNSIIESIVADRTECCKFFQTILEYSQSESFECWRFYLLFLRCVARIASDEYFGVADNVKSMIKQFFKEAFRTFLTTKDRRNFYAMMLNARQICTTNEEIIGTYAMWYKSTIGEMKYLMKNDEFKFTMETLIDMVEMENDSNTLKTHINTYIPAPPLCNEIVLNYVQMCKSRLWYCDSELKKNAANPNRSRESKQMEVIEID